MYRSILQPAEMPKVKVITSLETSEKVVKSLLCLDRPVIGVSCKAAGTESKSK